MNGWVGVVGEESTVGRVDGNGINGKVLVAEEQSMVLLG